MFLSMFVTSSIVAPIQRTSRPITLVFLLTCEGSRPLNNTPVSGHHVGVSSESQSPVEHVPEVFAGTEGGEPAPVARPLPHAVGGLVGHEDPGHPGGAALGVGVALPVEVGEVEHQGCSRALQAPVPCDPALVGTLTCSRGNGCRQFHIFSQYLSSSCETPSPRARHAPGIRSTEVSGDYCRSHCRILIHQGLENAYC